MSKSVFFVCALLGILSLASCDGGGGGTAATAPQPPSEPQPNSNIWTNSPAFKTVAVTTSDALSVSAGDYGYNDGWDPDDLEVTYQWFIEDRQIAGVNLDTLPAGLAKRGQKVHVSQVVKNQKASKVSSRSTITIGDAPGTLEVEFPIGSDVTPYEFTAILHDADLPGGSGAPPVAFAPDRLSISDDGAGTWDVDKSLFAEQVYTIGLRQGDTANAQIITYPIKIRAQTAWPTMSAALKPPLGNAAVIVGNFDGEGKSDVLGSDTTSVFLINYSAGTYQQNWLYPFAMPLGGQIVDLASLNFDDDAASEIIVFTELGISKIGGLKEMADEIFALRLPAHLDYIEAGAAAVVEGVPIAVAVTETGRLLVVNIATRELLLEWKGGVQAGDYDVQIGYTNDSSKLKIVLNSGVVIDAKTLQVDWDLGAPFSDWRVALIDIDGDGIQEIIGGNRSRPDVTAFSAVTGQNLVQQNAQLGNICSMAGGDIDNDSIPELVVSHCDAPIQAYKWAAGGFQSVGWNLDLYHNGVIGIGDSDDDNGLELHWTTGGNTTQTDGFHVADLALQAQLKWSAKSPMQMDYYYFAGWGSVDSDKEHAVFLARSYESDAHHTGGNRLLFIEEGGEMTTTDPIFSSIIGGTPTHARVADFGADGFADLLIRDPINNQMAAVQITTLTENWHGEPENSFGFPDVIDANADASPDAIYSIRDAVIVRDGATFTEICKIDNNYAVRDFAVYQENPSRFLLAMVEVDTNSFPSPVRIAVWRVTNGIPTFVASSDWSDNFSYERLQFANFDADSAMEVLAIPHHSSFPEYTSKLSVFEIRPNGLIGENFLDVDGKIVDLVVRRSTTSGQSILALIKEYLPSGASRARYVVKEISLNRNPLWSSPALLGQPLSRGTMFRDNPDSGHRLGIGTTDAAYLIR